MNISEALEKYKSAKFRYGDMDCCLFVANVIQDMIGRDFALPWRDLYVNERGAIRIIQQHGGMAGLVSAAIGQMLPVSRARTGDPVLIGPPLVERDVIGQGLGICSGATVTYLTDDGLADAPILLGLGCWNV